jgi:hypothetical protein
MLWEMWLSTAMPLVVYLVEARLFSTGSGRKRIRGWIMEKGFHRTSNCQIESVTDVLEERELSDWIEEESR